MRLLAPLCRLFHSACIDKEKFNANKQLSLMVEVARSSERRPQQALNKLYFRRGNSWTLQ